MSEHFLVKYNPEKHAAIGEESSGRTKIERGQYCILLRSRPRKSDVVSVAVAKAHMKALGNDEYAEWKTTVAKSRKILAALRRCR